MQKLGKLSDWQELEQNEAIQLPVSKSKRVTIHVNAAQRTTMFYMIAQKNGSPSPKAERVYLATVEGRDTLQFLAPDFPIAVVADATIQIQTKNDLFVAGNPSGESYTRPVDISPVDPNMAAILKRQNEHAAKMAMAMEGMRIQMSEMNGRTKQANEVKPDDDKPKSGSGDDGSTSKQKSADDPGSSDEPNPKEGEGGDPKQGDGN